MAMQQLILSFNNREEVLELPYPLQEHSIANSHNTYTFNTINQGEVLAIGKKKLKSMTINSFFPAHQYPFLLTKKFPEPNVCISTIEKWRLSNKPIRVIIVDTDINYAMAIEEFVYGVEQNDGSGDISFTLTLREYSFLNVERSKKPDDVSGLKNRPNEKVDEKGAKLHTIKEGDTLYDLADKHYGDGKKWKIIAKANKITDPGRLKLGTDITIPPKETPKKARKGKK